MWGWCAEHQVWSGAHLEPYRKSFCHLVCFLPWAANNWQKPEAGVAKETYKKIWYFLIFKIKYWKYCLHFLSVSEQKETETIKAKMHTHAHVHVSPWNVKCWHFKNCEIDFAQSLIQFYFSFVLSFDLVTLGAMSVTLMFQRPPFLPQTRTVWTPNNNFLVLDQVTMSREEAQPVKCDIRSAVSPYPLVLPYPLPRYTASCEEKGPVVPELQVWKLPHSSFLWRCAFV